KSERGVGPGSHRDPFVRRSGRTIAVRIDDDHPGSAPAGLVEEGDEVDVRRDDVRSPNDDEIRMDAVFRIDSIPFAEDDSIALVRAVVADVRALTRRAESMEDRVAREAVHDPHRARVVIEEERLPTVAVARGEETLGGQ